MLYLAAMVTNFSMSGWSLVALVAWSCWSPARPAPQKNSEKCVAPVNRSMIATATRPTSLQEESRLIPSQPTTRRTRNDIKDAQGRHVRPPCCEGKATTGLRLLFPAHKEQV